MEEEATDEEEKEAAGSRMQSLKQKNTVMWGKNECITSRRAVRLLVVGSSWQLYLNNPSVFR